MSKPVPFPITSLLTLAETHPEFLAWLQACAFLTAAYGPQAHTLTILTGTTDEYDDEHWWHGDACTLDAILVCDWQGRRLAPDPTRQYCQQTLQHYAHNMHTCSICADAESNGNEGHRPERGEQEAEAEFLERLWTYGPYWPVKPGLTNQTFRLDEPPLATEDLIHLLLSALGEAICSKAACVEHKEV